MVLFEVQGYGDTPLTPLLYIVQTVWCVLVFVPFVFIIRCWQRFAWTRNTRTFFTLYLSGIDSASRLILLHYYILRLVMIYEKGLWLDDSRGFIKLPCDASVPIPLNSSLSDPCEAENIISRSDCLTFSLFLYWASSWPMSSILLLQLHALAGSIVPTKYERIATVKFASVTMCIAFLIDLIMGVCGYEELKITYMDDGSPEIMDACKFEYFSRLSVIHSSYVFVLLCAIGILALVQLIVGCVNERRQKKFVNAAANSPIHGWSQMPLRERVLTISIMTCAIASFILFLIHFIVYLVQGNSLLRQILNITISVFAFIGPIELMWFNIDIRKAVFILVFGRKESQSSAEDVSEKTDRSTSSSNLTDEMTCESGTETESESEKATTERKVGA